MKFSAEKFCQISLILSLFVTFAAAQSGHSTKSTVNASAMMKNPKLFRNGRMRQKKSKRRWRPFASKVMRIFSIL
ncbi:MAG: hypothetical protein LC778_02660 [Acidobacteria bacterium]|nr:hypothetical protein [Acidobacteriota bacterium]